MQGARNTPRYAHGIELEDISGTNLEANDKQSKPTVHAEFDDNFTSSTCMKEDTIPPFWEDLIK